MMGKSDDPDVLGDRNGVTKLRSLKRFGTVIFDCDATLSQIEGIEELGREHRAAIEELTDAAMGGKVPLEEIYGRRLGLARPNRARVEEVGRMYFERIVPDTEAVIATLHAEGINVRIISAGVRQAVLMLAHRLGVRDEHVAAVEIYFDENGEYSSFDVRSPVSAAGGKRRVIEEWSPALNAPIMLVGDGATDLEARPVVDLFVAFAGVAHRPAVVANADVVIRARSLAPVLPLALGGEPPADPAARQLYDRGLELLDLAIPDN